MTVIATNTAQQAEQRQQQSIASKKKSLLACGVGNLLEWFDWTIYAVASVYIANALFDKTDPTSALLNTLAVFAVGFVSRPIGGFVFGPLANKIGRKNVMLVTMLMMAASSMIIGLIPSYAQIGAWSSGLLLFARLLQGFAHGGETSTSYAYVAEIAPINRRGLWSSTSFFAVGAGSLTGTLFVTLLTFLLTKEQMYDWGWRVPFLAGGALAIFALYLRRHMEETHSETHTASEEVDEVNWPTSKIMKEGGKLFFYEAASALLFYTWVSCASIYAINSQKMDPKYAFLMSCIAQVIYLIVLPFQGLLSDFISRKKNTLITYVGCSLFIFPLWSLITSEPWTLLVSQTAGLILIGFLMSCKPAAMSEQIPTKYRTKVFGFFMSLAIAVCGGTAGYLNTWLYSIDKGWIFNVYSIVMCGIAIIAVLTWKNNSKIDLNKVS